MNSMWNFYTLFIKLSEVGFANKFIVLIFLNLISNFALAGPSEDEVSASLILTCKKFYEAKKEFVYDYDFNQLNFVLKTSELEIKNKYSQDDAAKLWINAVIKTQASAPKDNDYTRALTACRSFLKAADEKIKSKGKLLEQ